MKKLNAKISIYLILLAAIGAIVLRAQSPEGISGKGFLFPYRDAKDSTLKAILTGKTAKQITGSQVLVTDFKMKSLKNGDTNQIELVAEAPECLMDRSNNVASSSGAIKSYSATTNLYIQGIGFFLQQSNGFLVISNQVETRIHKDSLRTNAALQTFTSSASTNDILKIFADQSENNPGAVAFRFLYESNLVTYTGKVRAEDSQMELNCDVLNIFLTTNRAIYRIVADSHVVIINKKDQSRVTGDQAVYTITPTGEMVELTGNPFWSDGLREGKADKFVFDRTNNIFRAEQNAVFKVPRDRMAPPNLLASGAAPTTSGIKVSSTNPVVISATVITFKMPATNGPIQEIIAETNVVITSESDQSRATADRAHYSESTGFMKLTGDPTWKLKGSELKGEIIVVGTNNYVAAKTNVYLKMPTTMFGQTFGTNGIDSTGITNQFVEVLSGDFIYNTNVATFRENVRGKTVDGNFSQTTLNSEFLQIHLAASNQVEKVLANENVVLHQVFGAAAQSKILEKTVTGDLIILNRSPKTGLLRDIHAEIKVVGEQIDQSPNGKTVKRISAELIDITFLPTTNQIQKIVAKQNVVADKIEQVGGTNKSASARGEQAVYDAANGVAEFTGEPSAVSENMLVHDATFLRWNLNTGKISATPYKITPLNTTNTFKAMLQPTP